MTIARDQHTNNIVLGAGEFYVDLLDASDNTGGERYVGDTVGGSLQVQTETTTVYSGDGPSSSLLSEVVTQVTRTITITMHDIQAANLALFVIGDVAEQTDAASAVTDETFNVRPGYWYPLGVSKTKPGGVIGVSADAFVVKQKNKTITADDTNYVVDAAHGRLYIPAGGMITAGEIKVTYTPVAQTVPVVKASDKQLRAAIRYVEDAADGKGNNYYAPRCNVSAAGTMELKSRDTEEQLQINCQVTEPKQDGFPALYINGQAA